MLRIRKVADSRTETTLHVEGRIVSAWVAVLERECRQELRETQRVRLDLAAVTFVDPHGVEALQRLAADNVAIVNGPEFIAALLSGEGAV